MEGRENGGQRGTEVVARWYPTTLPPRRPAGARVGRQRPGAESWRGQASRWVAATAPNTPGPAAAHRAEGPSLFTAGPGTAGAALAQWGYELGGGGNSPANRWRRRSRPVPAEPVGAAPERRRVPPTPTQRQPAPGGHSPARPPRRAGCASWRAGRGSLKTGNSIIRFCPSNVGKTKLDETPPQAGETPLRSSPPGASAARRPGGEGKFPPRWWRRPRRAAPAPHWHGAPGRCAAAAPGQCACGESGSGAGARPAGGRGTRPTRAPPSRRSAPAHRP